MTAKRPFLQKTGNRAADWFNKIKPKLIGSLWGIAGFWLSPLSWWNDLWVNIPIAYGIAWVIDIFYRPAFLPSFIISYWGTNLLGILMIRKGAETIRDTEKKPFSSKKLLFYLGVVLFYTVLVWILVAFEFITPQGKFLSN
ncbi:MAG: hypothetical protein ACE5GM_07885 [bacterium]